MHACASVCFAVLREWKTETEERDREMKEQRGRERESDEGHKLAFRQRGRP